MFRSALIETVGFDLWREFYASHYVVSVEVNNFVFVLEFVRQIRALCSSMEVLIVKNHDLEWFLSCLRVPKDLEAMPVYWFAKLHFHKAVAGRV